LVGDEEKPLPNCPGRTMKYFDGSRGLPSPTKRESMSCEVPEYMCGKRMTLSLASLRRPNVL
jgi:hypothetical protein